MKEKLECFKDAIRKEENWKKQSTKNGIELKVYSGEGNHSGVYGKMIMPYNNQFIMEILGDQEKVFESNEFGEDLKILEEFESKVKGALMVSGRDFIIANIQTTMEDPENKNQRVPILVSFSVEHPKAPKNPKGIVRGEIIIAGWILRKIDESQTEVISFAINDLKGSIPKFIANVGSSSHSSIMMNFMKQCEKCNKESLKSLAENDPTIINVSSFDE